MAGTEVRADIIANDRASDAFSRVGRSAAEMGIEMDVAAHEADKLDRALDRMSHKSIGVSADVNRAMKGTDKIIADAEKMLAGLDSAGSGGGGGGGLLSKLFSSGGGGGISGGMLAGVAAAVPALEAALVEVDGLVSGFAAAGAGAGAFGLLAMPAVAKVSGALQQINADQQAYDRALTKTAKNTALQHLKDDYADLSPAELAAVKGIQGLEAEFGKLARAFEPQAFKIFADVLQIANQLLPVVVPFANAFANALGGLLQQLGKFTASRDFRDWLAQFQKLVGPSVTAIGQGVGQLVIQFGKLLTIMSAKDVVRSINIAFDVLNGTIAVVNYSIRRLMDNWDGMSAAAKHSWYDLKRWTDDVTQAFDFVRHAIAHDADSVVHAFEGIVAGAVALGTGIFHAGQNIIGWFQALPGRIMHALTGLGADLWGYGKTVINDFWTGLKSIWSSVWNWFANIPSDILHALGIHSPPRWALEAGEHILQGLFGWTTAKKHQILARVSTLGAQVGAAAAASAARIGSGSVGTEQRYAAQLLTGYGWGQDQLGPLIALWNRESGWNPYAQNPSSGAAGIPQNIAGWSAYAPGDWAGQIRWGLDYIFGRYGSPAAAWGHEMQFGWYDRGGFLPPGLSLAWNTTGRPEPVGTGGGNTYNITVNVPPTVNPREAGRQVAQLILAHTKNGGRLYPHGVTPA